MILLRAHLAYALRGLLTFALLSLPATSAWAGRGDAPQLVAAQARKVHGTAGTLDLPLVLTLSAPTIEARAGPSHTLLLTFDKPIAAGRVLLTEGSATVGAPSFSGNQMSVSLGSVSNAQYVTVAVTEMAASDGGSGGAGSVRIGFLLGDADQSRAVDLADVNAINATLAQIATDARLTTDLDTSGAITLKDKRTGAAQSGSSLPPLPAPTNQPPRVVIGPAQTITLPNFADLSALVTDDGLPANPGKTTVQWSKVSGPGTVVFGAPTLAYTQASFSEPGVYVLRLRADDGAIANFADMTVTTAYGLDARGNMQLTMSAPAITIDVVDSSGGASNLPLRDLLKVSFQDAGFTTTASAMSPLLLDLLAKNTHVPTATLKVSSPSSAALISDWVYTDVTMSSISVSGFYAADAAAFALNQRGVPLVRFYFAFARVKYTVYAANGTVARTTCWDVNRNQSC